SPCRWRRSLGSRPWPVTRADDVAFFALFGSVASIVDSQRVKAMPPSILVVDDEPASVNLLRITLGMDYTVHTATDGPSALGLLAAQPDIAVGIIDQRSPGMPGT